MDLQADSHVLLVGEEKQNKSSNSRCTILVGSILLLGLIGCAAIAWQPHREMPRTSSNAIETQAKKTIASVSSHPLLNRRDEAKVNRLNLGTSPKNQPLGEMAKADKEGNLPTCPFGWKSIAAHSSEAVTFARCGMAGLPKAQHMVYTFGRVFMAAKQTVDTTTYVRMSVIIYRQKIVVPHPGKITPVAVHMEVAQVMGHCGLKNVVGMYDGLPLNDTTMPHYPPNSNLPPANPSGWQKIPNPQHIVVEAKSAAEFAAKKMTHCPFVSMEQPNYQVMGNGFRFQMTVMVKSATTGKNVPCMAEVHAGVHSDYTLVKGHCFPNEGC